MDTMEQRARYDFKAIEARWQQDWAARDLFRTRLDAGRPSFYYLDMFPYPSGHLHMGHLRNYTIGDVISRYHVMRGENVLHPMGWDAFGLPAENAAIKHQTHPDPWTRRCIEQMHEQLNMLGISFDWDREVNTSSPDYYRWTQWLFLRFFEAGLVGRQEAAINWCPSCATVLANEQVLKDGTCERCSALVAKKRLEQWFYKTTAYAQRLLDDIDQLDDWPDAVRTMQRNWIGRSEGFQFAWPVVGSELSFEVFTTRIDTVYGVTFMVLAPEHPLVEQLVAGQPQEAAVKAFVQQVLGGDQFARQAADAPKEGVFTGAFARHPLTGAEVPIWLANYVMMDYGTGAIMAVPAHDERDFAFATKYQIPVVPVILPEGETVDGVGLPYLGDGVQANSGPYNGLPNRPAMVKMAEDLESAGTGQRTVNFRLRDWCLSRQRYWGCPIPVIYCPACGVVPVPDDHLPVLLPTDVAFTGEGNPIASSATFRQTTCPHCGAAAQRETDTMDTFVDSSWYFLRYASQPADSAFDRAELDRWMPVAQYVGGIEHATMHLIYARFFTKVLYDLGLVGCQEPFARLFTQGMVTKEAWWCDAEKKWYTAAEQLDAAGRTPQGHATERIVKKMSKSIGNVVAPESICDSYGADTGRCYILFVGPPEAEAEWQDEGVSGVHRFLTRLWRCLVPPAGAWLPDWRAQLTDLDEPARAVRRKLHQTIERITSGIERFALNTSVAALMELVNVVLPFVEQRIGSSATLADRAVYSEAAEVTALLLSPFAPHLADEIWAATGHHGSTYEATWPVADATVAKAARVTVVVQVNGKVRARLEVEAGVDEAAVRAAAAELGPVVAALAEQPVRKAIWVPGKLLNLVT
ncbi:MAG: leucine--tRNA ligase [Fimbriimonadaceae bacterium]|nr:leucine--tRNA ligase [Fimbriimonadaceae bacterium]